MSSDLDIYRAANLLIKQHGDEAAIQAAMRADQLLDAGAQLTQISHPERSAAAQSATTIAANSTAG